MLYGINLTVWRQTTDATSEADRQQEILIVRLTSFDGARLTSYKVARNPQASQGMRSSRYALHGLLRYDGV